MMNKKYSTTMKKIFRKEMKGQVLDLLLHDYEYKMVNAESILAEEFDRKPTNEEVEEYRNGLSGLLDAAEMIYEYIEV